MQTCKSGYLNMTIVLSQIYRFPNCTLNIIINGKWTTNSGISKQHSSIFDNYNSIKLLLQFLLIDDFTFVIFKFPALRI